MKARKEELKEPFSIDELPMEVRAKIALAGLEAEANRTDPAESIDPQGIYIDHATGQLRDVPLHERPE